MARTLYLPDGTTEVILGDPEETLRRVIDERLGRDCEELFTELLEEARHPLGGDEGENYERIADGYLNLLRDTLDELAPVIDMCNKPRMDKAKAHRKLKAIWDNIYKNI